MDEIIRQEDMRQRALAEGAERRDEFREVSFSELQRIITVEYIGSESEDVRRFGIFGSCATRSTSLEFFLLDNYKIKTKEVHSFAHNYTHTYLTCQTTDRGEIIIDPTINQFVEYGKLWVDIFVGTKEELKSIFLDEERDFYWTSAGKNPPKKNTRTREEWFDIFYNSI